MSDCPLGWHVNYNILKSGAHYLGSSLKYIKRLRMCGNFYNLRTQRQNEYACSATRAIKAFRATIFFSKNELTRLFPPKQQTFFSGGWGGGVGWGLSSEEAMTRRTKMTTGARNHVKGCSTSVTKFTPVTKKSFFFGWDIWQMWYEKLSWKLQPYLFWFGLVPAKWKQATEILKCRHFASIVLLWKYC